jgi:hypothetical protein
MEAKTLKAQQQSRQAAFLRVAALRLQLRLGGAAIGMLLAGRRDVNILIFRPGAPTSDQRQLLLMTRQLAPRASCRNEPLVL